MSQLLEFFKEALKHKYSITKEIHPGNNAYAFKARHIVLEKYVFLKIYHFIESEKRIFQEPRYIDALKSHQCINIMKLLDVDIIDNSWVVVASEYFDGGDLSTLIPTGLGLRDAINIAKGILEGLLCLHNDNFLHRDLKPANIMLSCNSKNIPIIIDFGSVVKIEKSDDDVSPSRYSVLYLPPEAWSKKIYNKQSDIYQIGFILYEMINGCLPYSNDAFLDQEGKAELKKLNKKFVSDLDDYEQSKFIDGCIGRRAQKGKLLSLCPSMPYFIGRIKQIVQKATHVDLSCRYKSTSTFLGELLELNMPNWKSNKTSYIAEAWCGYDWQLYREKNTWIVKRKKNHSSSWRNWKSDEKIDFLIRAVNSYPSKKR